MTNLETAPKEVREQILKDVLPILQKMSDLNSHEIKLVISNDVDNVLVTVSYRVIRKIRDEF
ncbi:MAG: hypothetical protein ACYDAP_00110 [Thermoplasmataceae archaeon]|jgi:hypothetical protein